MNSLLTTDQKLLINKCLASDLESFVPGLERQFTGKDEYSSLKFEDRLLDLIESYILNFSKLYS